MNRDKAKPVGCAQLADKVCRYEHGDYVELYDYSKVDGKDELIFRCLFIKIDPPIKLVPNARPTSLRLLAFDMLYDIMHLQGLACRTTDALKEFPEEVKKYVDKWIGRKPDAEYEDEKNMRYWLFPFWKD